MRPQHVCLIALVLAVVSTSVSAQVLPAINNCTYWNQPRQQIYSLLAMTRTIGQPEYNYTNPNNNVTTFVNICGTSQHQCGPNQGVCVQGTDGSVHGRGSSAEALWSSYIPDKAADGVSILYPEGSPCNGLASLSFLNIKCDKSVPNGVIDGITEFQPCRLSIDMRSKWACGIDPVRPPPAPTCTFDNPVNNMFYNLSGLTRGPGQAPFKYHDVNNDFDYFINICGQADAPCQPQNGMCAHSPDGVYFGCGDATTRSFTAYQPEPQRNGLTLVYFGGDSCGDVKRTTSINLLCDPNTDGIVDRVLEPEQCFYKVFMRSRFACGQL